MSSEPDMLNIPAFMRKRSISAKARKGSTTIKTRKATKRGKHVEVQQEMQIINGFDEDEIINDEISSAPKRNFREMEICGICEGYLDQIDVAIIKLTKPLREYDKIIFEKDGGLFEQTVKSMQINRKDVKLARTGSDIGLKVLMKPTVGAQVYKII